jgi:GNAT superfamily N-acetyltransferase
VPTSRNRSRNPGFGEEHETMTQTLSSRTTVGVRPYRPADHSACHGLWAEFVEQQRALYGDAKIGGADPGSGFEEYLTRLDLSGMWVADDQGVVGLVGLVLSGRGGAVDPLVVTGTRRGEGIGRRLIAYVTEQARRRGLRELSISPALRNTEAIHCLHAAGYEVMTNITLSLNLGRPASDYREGLELHDRRFRY